MRLQVLIKFAGACSGIPFRSDNYVLSLVEQTWNRLDLKDTAAQGTLYCVVIKELFALHAFSSVFIDLKCPKRKCFVEYMRISPSCC